MPSPVSDIIEKKWLNYIYSGCVLTKDDEKNAYILLVMKSESIETQDDCD